MVSYLLNKVKVKGFSLTMPRINLRGVQQVHAFLENMSVLFRFLPLFWGLFLLCLCFIILRSDHDVMIMLSPLNDRVSWFSWSFTPR